VLGPLGRRVKNLLAGVLESRGYRVVPGDLPWAVPHFAHRAILECGVSAVLDIGANVGQFAIDLRASGFAGRVVSFEPQAAAFAALSQASAADPGWECHRLGLASQPGRLAMHISAFSPSSSMLPIGQRHVELFPFTAETGIEEVEVVRLDDWVAARTDLPAGLFLKVDTQGFETPVLKGGTRTLAAAAGALVELNFAELFDGQSKYYDVMRLLDEAGLKLFSLFDMSLAPENRSYLWGDGLFLRPEAAARVTRVIR